MRALRIICTAKRICAAVVLLTGVLGFTRPAAAQFIPACNGTQVMFESDYLRTYYGEDHAYSIVKTTPGLHDGYLLTGETQSFGSFTVNNRNSDFYMILAYPDGSTYIDAAIGFAAGFDVAHSGTEVRVAYADKGFVAAGRTNSTGHGGEDVMVVRTNFGLIPQWTRILGGSGEDVAWSVKEVSDANGGGVIVAGYTNSYGRGNYDFYAIRIDNAGAVLWERAYGGPQSDQAYDVAEFDDGTNSGFVLTGTSRSFGSQTNDMLTAAWIDHSGNLLWTRAYYLSRNGCSGNCHNYGYSGKPLGIMGSHNGYIFAGTIKDNTNDNDAVVVRTDANGFVSAGGTWARYYNSAGNQNDQVREIRPINDGQFAVCGWIDQNDEDMWFLTLDASGNNTGGRVVNIANYDEQAHSLVQADDGGFAIAGWSNSQNVNNNDNVYLVKLDCNRNGGTFCNDESAPVNEGTLDKTVFQFGFQATALNTVQSAGPNYDVEAHGAYIVCAEEYDPPDGQCCAAGKPTWQNTIDHYNGTQPTDQEGRAIDRLQDGGYAIFGFTEDAQCGNGVDPVLTRYDAAGNLSWSRIYPADPMYGVDYDSYIYDGEEIDEGQPTQGFMLAGFSNNTPSMGPGSNDDMYLIRTDANGNWNWSTNYGHVETDRGHAAMQTSDGGFIIAGYSESFQGYPFQGWNGGQDVYVVKTDNWGNPQWAYVYGGEREDVAWAVEEVYHDPFHGVGYIVVGSSRSFGPGQQAVYVLRLDQAGAVVWSRTYGGTGNESAGYAVREVSDANGMGFIIAGETNEHTNGLNYDAFAFRIDYNGSFVHAGAVSSVKHVYGRFNSPLENDRARAILQDCEGNYVLSGYSASYTPTVDAYTVNLDEFGAVNWAYVYGSDVGDDRAYDILQNWNPPYYSEGSYSMAGVQEKDAFGLFHDDIYFVTTACNGTTEDSYGSQCDFSAAPGAALWNANSLEPVTRISADLAQYYQYVYDKAESCAFNLTSRCYNANNLKREGAGELAEQDPALPGPAPGGLYPNPVEQGAVLHLNFAAPAPGRYTLEVRDMLGRTVSRMERSFGAGAQTVSLATEQWTAGAYVVRLQQDDTTILRSMVIVR